jgi:hypothetical protein
MNAYYQADQEDEQVQSNQIMHKPQYSSLYFITHLILSFFAIYLSWRCAGAKFEALNFIAALCCPHLYIIWALATHGGCGVFDNLPVTSGTSSSSGFF